MLTLLHWEPNGNSGRPILCLKEKGLDFTSRYVDVLRFEQHTGEVLALNRKGEVPVLLQDGDAYTEASFIEQYLDEAFPGAALMPKDALGRWRVRAWQKHVDEELAPFVGQLDADALRTRLLETHSLEQLEATVQRVPDKQRRDLWAAAVLQGHTETQLQEARRKISAFVTQELEPALAGHEWLSGSEYSIADGAAFMFINFLPRLMSELANARTAPATMDWLRRMHDRPAVRATLTMARNGDPFALAATGPEPIRWG
jgi:glutathione S-transferase/GST-like protein